MKTFPVYLNGTLTVTEKTYVVNNPATGQPVARMSTVDRSAVAQAIKVAHQAFFSWRELPAKARGEFLHKVAADLSRRRDEIARLITLENGKPLAQSQGEVTLAIDHLGWFGEEARRGYGRIIAGAAKLVKPLSLELGGHAPVLIFDDADLNQAVDGAMLAKFRNTGQSCIAANRIYVQRGVYEKFLSAFVEKVRGLQVGDGLDPKAQIGPLIDEPGVAKAVEHVQDAVRRGARLLCGGNRLPGPGHFFEPAVLADVPRDGLCMREETFAP